ncbi:MAG: stage II sporulation protein P [Firmicutes bacterium]|nr:stage II sporulation protein P [Bacillota bacterium]
MRRHRARVVIWFWRGHSRKAPRRRFHWQGTSLGMYLAVLGLAGATMVLTPPSEKGPIIPVIAPLQHANRPSLTLRWIGAINPRFDVMRQWLSVALPLLGQTSSDKEAVQMQRWLSVMGTALVNISGVQLKSLPDLLQVGIPDLAALPSGPQPTVHPQNVKKKLPNPVVPGLPGDGSRLWACLGSRPTVGIYQTHSTESFWSWMPAGSPAPLSTHWSHTVVQVGWWLAKDLHQDGIETVQARTNNMAGGLLDAYDMSYHTAETLLTRYPSVRILLDVHRATWPQKQSVATYGTHSVAKILFVVGTNQYLPDAHWKKNLAFAQKLVQQIKKDAPYALYQKGVNIVPYRDNEQISSHALIVYIGSEYNTPQELKAGAKIVAQAVAAVDRSQRAAEGDRTRKAEGSAPTS